MVVVLSCVQDKPALPEDESREREEEETDVTADGGYWYGVRCLMLTWAVTGLMSLDVEPIVRALGAAKNLWAAENFILAGSLAITLYISKLVKDERLERNDLTFTREPSNDIQT
ncbi:Sucrose transport protein [Arachis hypogaea]|nr:Sucrose transport protein [Arachis hypogaea]